jgi:dTDP-4-dehydrorhamnose reductase
VTFSTDYVFDGTTTGGYVESDQTNPQTVYGVTKLEGEQLALHDHPDALVVRTSWLLSGTHPNFASTMIKLTRNGPVSVVDDQRGRPTLADDLARVTLDAIDHGATGVLHLANEGVTTWFGLAREIAAIAGLDPERVSPCTTAEFPRPAPRPADSVLNSERLAGLAIEPMPPYRPGLEAAVRALMDSEWVL